VGRIADMQEKLKILCVDDDPAVLNANILLLEICGVEVVTSSCGSEALEIVQNQGTFFMVLSDYDMPNMKGTELLRQIREYCPQAVRVLSSGGLVKHEVETFIRNGDCEDFLAKPWNSSELINLIYNEMMSYKIEALNVFLNTWNQNQQAEKQIFWTKKRCNVIAVSNLISF
jgi:CheY-like chemotaxis protein